MRSTEGSVHGRLALAAIAAVLLFAGWRVLALGMADQLAGVDPARALQWRGDHPGANLRQAERLAAATGAVPAAGEGAASDDADAAVAPAAAASAVADPAAAATAAEHAREALRREPLDGRPFRVLAQLAAAAGDRERAAFLNALAIRRTPRDLSAQAWLVDYHLSRGEVAPALARVDALMRVSPPLVAKLTPLMAQLAAVPAAQQALAELLGRQPPWRQRVVIAIARDAADSLAVAPLMDALRNGPGGLSDLELGAWTDRLVRDGQIGKAYVTWASTLPPEHLQRLGNVYNGSFEWAPRRGGFDWRFTRIAGARIDRLAVTGADGQVALRVAFEDRRVPFSHVRQLLALPPGSYRLTGRARPQNLRTQPGLVWEVACFSRPGTPLARTAPLKGHGDWRSFEVDFEVPANGCVGQWLVLRHPARIAAEQRIGGHAWFDDLRITRVR
ncbi:tetratricopeptide repeat protein [Arenimonas composti]|uniref:CBM-cenC domain-containing protein n=1 Tax=Arenimonas composti TR7-09 = DSM 18010 TaxID=1121013 RepID=A0A091B887_9GAMM|nr:hypothetical protein [Arenimonas composti]KFN48863.1 hypothetical protein P873_12995 [Arenimonas composti TR7-09 = DSM 18010]